jgi:uncharacterized protein YkuJ
MRPHTPAEILDTLRSIHEVQFDEDGVLDVRFERDGELMCASEYKQRSFMRELLELIEYHLTYPAKEE